MKILTIHILFLVFPLIFGAKDYEDHEASASHLSQRAFGAFRSLRYAWICRDERCVKVERASGIEPGENGLSLGVCKLNCGKSGTLWPIPTGKVEIGKETIDFYPENLEFEVFQAEEPVKTMLETASATFKSYLTMMHPDSGSNSKFKFPVSERNNRAGDAKVRINIAVAWPDSTLTLKTDETYTLAASTSEDGNLVQVSITGNTYFGVRHALETLSQLITFNDETETLTIVDRMIITDKPVFPYRGILVDTSRNFVSIPIIKRLIDGLSYNKLNFFHWHITDTHSFPFESRRHPQLTEYGAYSSRKIYTVAEMKEVVEYGRLRGVRVLPEFDAPAHVGNGWQWGPSEGLGNLAVCVNKEPWNNYCVEPPCGQLNPANENMYKVLGDLYRDFFDIFENDLFHMGGDEVNLNCWNSTEEVTKWMTENGRGLTKDDFIDVWGEFQEKAFAELVAANGGKHIDTILWTSELASEAHIKEHLSNSSYIIQVWSNGQEEAQIIPFLIQNGYRTIFTQVDAWYLDCGYGAWVGNEANNWCSPYKGWQTGYMNNPIKILGETIGEDEAYEAYRKGLVVGGEAAMWSEQVDEHAMESKIWPRGAALAERLWSDPSTGWYESEPRMVHHRQRFVERGIPADRLQPEWCHQNEGHCFL